MSISQSRLEQLRGMIAAGDPAGFYNWPEWDELRAQVLAAQNYECQRCRGLGRYRKAEIVHHVMHVRDRPDLALSVVDPDSGERQLVSLCRACHEEQHPERGLKQRWTPRPPLTFERWD